ncbi:M1 family metallopeptidase [Shewanella sp. AS1]|uniref:M1 family aminopeptidase n=1 Tax=Shewanella sp. AS1 TaxID=2907626 RepID=UPI001F165C63|nr:M1 family aminopeptidase [Shewanella sp. AS1]MCE9677822.1 M1 family metallopeptidase [Shewanella sp. AS1]
MKLLTLGIIGTIFLSLTACQSPQPTKSDKAGSNIAESDKAVATQASIGNIDSIARERGQRISDLQYRLKLDITQDDSFSGEASIEFNLKDPQSLTLDFNQAQLQQFSVNGHRIYPNYDGRQITLSAGLLNKGGNQIDLSFTRAYSSTNEGLIRYTDPLDGKAYLYTQFAPSHAQMMMPLFDQSDLKARFSLTVTAPKAWLVISATNASKTQGATHTQWQFATTAPISSHSFSLFAGPYQSWHQTETLPLGLYAPQSIASQQDAQAWLTHTGEAIGFYEKQFGTAYPFAKYDQILVPDIGQIAMANVAASSFEFSLPSEERFKAIALQALAEQWTGNLVTPRGWNEHWLSQSLARLMAKKAQVGEQAVPVWYQDKHNLYQTEERRHSRPIESALISDHLLEEHMNEATVTKGVALLTQLNFLLGEKAFNLGLKQYLTQHQYTNADVSEFIAALSQAAKRPLDEWSRTWLYQGGVNQIEAEFTCNDGRLTRLAIKQSATQAHPTLREQKVKLGLFTIGRHALHQNLNQAVTYKGPLTEIKRLQGVRCPALVFPNYQDWGYVKVKLDPISQTTALQELHKVEDPNFRVMLWQTLWDSVLAGDLSLKRFLGAIFVNAPHESDPVVLGILSGKINQIKELLEQMNPNQQHYSSRALRALEQMTLRLAITTSPGTQVQSLWFDTYVQLALSHHAKSHLAALLEGKEQLEGITLDQKRRWRIVIHLNRYDYPWANELLLEEKKRDNSTQGERLALIAEVAQPKANFKRQWFNRIQMHSSDGDSVMLTKLVDIMALLYPSEQKALSQATAEQRLEELSYLDSVNSSDFMYAYGQYLIPMNCTYGGIDRLKRVLNDNPTLSLTTQAWLEKSIQSEQQCVRILQQLTPSSSPSPSP